MSSTPTRIATDEDRLIVALAREAHATLMRSGGVHVVGRSLLETARETGVADHIAEHVLDSLEERGLLWSRDGGDVYDGLGLAIFYEEEIDRSAFRRGNEVRREILKLAAAAFEEGNRQGLRFHEGTETFIDRRWEEAVVACHFLNHYGLVKLHEFLGHNFQITITTAGYDLARDEAQLARVLPVSDTEDEEMHADVSPDALRPVIRSCEELLDARGWTDAKDELAEGDAQYQQGHWSDAVGRYYAATESGLKYRLNEAGVPFSQGAALKVLARIAADAGVIPRNYQSLFEFLDSIRSPRSHGRGGKPTQVPIGPAEALLLGNHARSLLLYLGHRPT